MAAPLAALCGAGAAEHGRRPPSAGAAGATAGAGRPVRHSPHAVCVARSTWKRGRGAGRAAAKGALCAPRRRTRPCIFGHRCADPGAPQLVAVHRRGCRKLSCLLPRSRGLAGASGHTVRPLRCALAHGLPRRGVPRKSLAAAHVQAAPCPSPYQSLSITLREPLWHPGTSPNLSGKPTDRAKAPPLVRRQQSAPGSRGRRTRCGSGYATVWQAHSRWGDAGAAQRSGERLRCTRPAAPASQALGAPAAPTLAAARSCRGGHVDARLQPGPRGGPRAPRCAGAGGALQRAMPPLRCRPPPLLTAAAAAACPPNPGRRQLLTMSDGEAPSDGRTPVTMLSGFLGSGGRQLSGFCV